MKTLKIVAALAAALVAGIAQAQNWPNRPVRMVVPFAPGGSSSIVARTFAIEMEKGLGQSIVVENKGGGGGNIAMQEVARADPDGYTMIISHVGSLAMNPFMYEKLPYDVDRDFIHVSLMAIVPALFVVHEHPRLDDAPRDRERLEDDGARLRIPVTADADDRLALR